VKTLYLDLISGISGDMFVGALLDLGVDFGALERDVAALGLSGYHLHAGRAARRGISGTKFEVHLEANHKAAPDHAPDLHHHHPHAHSHSHPQPHAHSAEGDGGHAARGASRDYGQIRRLIGGSQLAAPIRDRALRIFHRLAVAEGKVHNVPPERVHFHEVGAVDSIVDVVGACLALEGLGPVRVLASAVVEGRGWVDCAHGRFPVPAPATLEILGARGISVSQCDEPQELVTPTGAALLAELVEGFGPMQDLLPERIGYGLGTRDHPSRPNVLRAILGETVRADPAEAAHDWETDTIAVLETNLDDFSPAGLGHFLEQALAAGALDVFHTPVQMKKNRPGTLLTVLCARTEADRFAELILRETTAFGVRRTEAVRRKLRRQFRHVNTPFGAVTLKLGCLDGRTIQAAPEYESCRQVAAARGVSLRQVYDAARQSAASEGIL